MADPMEVPRLEKAAEWLLRLAEDPLGEEEMEQWLRWYEASPDNAAAFDRMQSLWQGVSNQPASMDVAALPIGATARRATAITARPEPLTRGFRRRSLAAVVAAGFAAAVLVVLLRLPSITAKPLQTQIAAPAHANETSALPDGSYVDLGADSKLSLDFSGRQRHLSMQNGTAYFKVKPDKSRPFVVHAGPVDVTAVGTAFNIRRHDDRVVVTVEEGTVRIDKHPELAARNTVASVADDWSELRATSGYQLIYNAGTHETRLHAVDPAIELAWKHGWLEYSDEPLADVIADVNRYSSRTILLGDPALGELRFSGTVQIASVTNWLAALQRTFPITEQYVSTQIVLRQRMPAGQPKQQ